MSVSRRHFLQATCAAMVATGLPRAAMADTAAGATSAESIAEITAAVRAKKISVEDIVKARLAAAQANSILGAWERLDVEGALAQARAIDQTIASGKPVPPLAGVTVGVKDLFRVTGLPCRAGSRLTSIAPSERDAALVQQLRRSGAVILGTTTMPEFANGPTPNARNPYDLRRTPGSSSAGSAIAVAAGHVPLAIGTQTNASMVRPAAFCGVVAFKPTQGTLSLEGSFPLVKDLDQPGFMTRGIDDMVLTYTAVSNIGTVARPSPAPKPYAFIRTTKWPMATEKSRGYLEAVAKEIRAEEIVLPNEFGAIWDWLDIIMNKEYADSLAAYRSMESEMTAPMKRAVAAGRSYSAAQFDDAVAGQKALKDWGRKHLPAFGGVITPASTGPAVLLDQGAGSPVFSTVWSLMGAPAVTLPLFKEEGLPVAVQVVGAPNSDWQVLAAAQHIWDRCYPKLSASLST